jgi:hypothetical protein
MFNLIQIYLEYEILGTLEYIIIVVVIVNIIKRRTIEI